MRIKEFLSDYLRRNTAFTPDTIRRMVELMEDADRKVMSFDGALIERMNADIYQYPREMEQILISRLILFTQSLATDDDSDSSEGQRIVNIEVDKLIHDDELAKRLLAEGFDDWFSRLARQKAVLLKNDRHGYHVLLDNKAYTISFNSYFDPSKIDTGSEIAGYIENHGSFCILDVEPENRKKSMRRRPPHFADAAEPVQLAVVDSVNIHAEMKMDSWDNKPIISIYRKDEDDTTKTEIIIDNHTIHLLSHLESIKDITSTSMTELITNKDEYATLLDFERVVELNTALFNFIDELDVDKAQHVCKTIRRIASYISLLYDEMYEDLNDMYQFLELRRHQF